MTRIDLSALVEKRFVRLGEQYTRRKSQAESCVDAWHWATRPVWDLNPPYFEMNGEKPGRNLPAKPAQLNGAFSYGTDSSGRIVVERQYSEFGRYERFFD